MTEQSTSMLEGVHPSVILWSNCVFNSTCRYNAKMIPHFWSLHPHLKDNWLEACSGLNDASHDDGVVDIFDDSDGVDTVDCLVTLSSSLDSPSADAADHMFYAVDVCNCFSFQSIENTPVNESSQVTNSTSNIATSSSIADDMSRALHQLA